MRSSSLLLLTLLTGCSASYHAAFLDEGEIRISESGGGFFVHGGDASALVNAPLEESLPALRPYVEREVRSDPAGGSAYRSVALAAIRKSSAPRQGASDARTSDRTISPLTREDLAVIDGALRSEHRSLRGLARHTLLTLTDARTFEAAITYAERSLAAGRMDEVQEAIQAMAQIGIRNGVFIRAGGAPRFLDPWSAVMDRAAPEYLPKLREWLEKQRSRLPPQSTWAPS